MDHDSSPRGQIAGDFLGRDLNQRRACDGMLKLAKHCTAAFLLFSLGAVRQAGVVYSAEMEKFAKKSSFEVWATETSAKFSVSH